MRYLALAADYDGTIASNGLVTKEVLSALEQLVASGRKVILVTGRMLEDLLSLFPEIGLCERVVAENGALLYRPGTRDLSILGPPPPPAFLAELARRGVAPLSVGRSMVATVRLHEITILEIIRDLGLELQIVFNREAVMVLPAGVNKASGLTTALNELALSPHNVIGIGDSENDHALLSLCEYSVAPANAVPAVKELADHCTDGSEGSGVVEFISGWFAGAREPEPAVDDRRRVLLGAGDDGTDLWMPAWGRNVLLAGTSGSGKSTLATGLLERLSRQGYQCCVIDPEGDYESFTGAIVFGDTDQGPSLPGIASALARPDVQVIVNLVGLPLQERPSFFLGLMPRLSENRARHGRPHWIVVDEVHHLLPADWQPAPQVMPTDAAGMIFVTVHPDQVARSVLDTVDAVIALGGTPDATVKLFCRAVQYPIPEWNPGSLDPGEAMLWRRGTGERPTKFRVAPSETYRRRHRRKYAEGELDPSRSFYFRGPDNRLNLRAQNLMLFAQLADGLDDATWEHHLSRGDYSDWMRNGIKDEVLAEEVAQIERARLPSPESRRRIKAAIEQYYTWPAAGAPQT